MNDYKDERIQLLKLLDELEPRLAKIKEDVTHTDQALSADFAEQATEMENSEVIDFLGNATQKEIRQIRQAIHRIDTNEYGACLNCGANISPQRLAILPFTEQCIDCAHKSEDQ